MTVGNREIIHAKSRQSDPPLRRSIADMEVAGPRKAPTAYWSENKAPAAQLNWAGAVRMALMLTAVTVKQSGLKSYRRTTPLPSCARCLG
jgi:hypothetical protein